MPEEKKPSLLQEHQIRALSKLQRSDKGIIVYHGLGSGKTLTGLAASKLNDGASVIGPASLKSNFKKENKRHKVNADFDYSTYSKPTPKNQNLIIYDEGHRMGRMESQQSRYPEKFKAKKNLILTGTPIRNEPAELIPLLRAVGVDIPRDKKKFEEKYIKTEVVKPSLIGKLKGVKPGIIRTGKNLDDFEVLIKGKVDYHESGKEGYPTTTSEDVYVPMSDNQIKAYRMATKGKPSLAYKVRFGLPPGKNEAGEMNAFLNATRQISNTAAGYNQKAKSEISPKVMKMYSDIEKGVLTDKNYRGVTYSNYLESGIERIESRLKGSNIPYAKFTGKTPEKDRKQIIKDYNAGKIKQLLISGAGSEGLDLKGTKMVQIMEPHWNEARTKQVKGRAVRFESHKHLPESDRNVTIKNYYSVFPESSKYEKLVTAKEKGVDEYIQAMVQRKQKLNEDFLGVMKVANNRFRYVNHARFKMFPPEIQEAALRGRPEEVKAYLSAAAIKGHKTRKANKVNPPRGGMRKLTEEEAANLKKFQERNASIQRKRKDMPQVDNNKLQRGYDPIAVSMALRDVKPSQIDVKKKKLKRLVKDLKNRSKGDIKPIIVSKDNFILDGHHRHRAAKEIWGDKTKVRMLKMKEKQKKALDKLKDYK